jgi:hypothetical protein
VRKRERECVCVNDNFMNAHIYIYDAIMCNYSQVRMSHRHHIL